MPNTFRITEDPVKGLTGALFGVALLAAIARTIIQVNKRQPLSVHDAFFAFACVCLCASTILLYLFTPALYFEQKLHSDPSKVSPESTISIISKYSNSHKLAYAHLILIWAVIFSVKFSFLFFFKGLIKRLTNLNVYWRVVAWTSAVSCFYCIFDIIISCPKMTLSGSQCWNDPHSPKPIILVAIAISLDILTEVMIIAIPVRLLWAVQIRTSQKLRLGLSLCLGIFMIITSLVKISGLRDSRGVYNITWVTFWHHAEGCIAVLMVSLIAFRSLFVSPDPSHPRPSTSTLWSSRLRLRRAQQDQDLRWTDLPSTPPAALTGMHTYIGPSSGPPLNMGRSLSPHSSYIGVHNEFSVESEPV